MWTIVPQALPPDKRPDRRIAESRCPAQPGQPGHKIENISNAILDVLPRIAAGSGALGKIARKMR